jgi:CRP-like cAMP-binding protein
VAVNYRAEFELAEASGKAHVLDPSITGLSEGRTQHEYLPDEPVFSQGDPAFAVFYIQRGEVRLTVKSVEGEQVVISTLGEGSFLGESCLAGWEIRNATASALLLSTIVRIEKQTLMDLLRRDPEFAKRFLRYTLTRGICIEAELGSRVFNSPEKHLTRREKKVEAGTEWKPIPVAAMMSPESMAETIGTTSSNVRSILDSFRERGFVDSKGAEMLVHSSLMSLAPHDDGMC